MCLFKQLLTIINQVHQFLIGDQVDLQCGGIALAVHQQVAIQRTMTHLAFSHFDIDIIAFQRAYRARYLGKRHRWAFHQRHIQQAGHRCHLLKLLQFFAQTLDVGQHGAAEQFLFRAVGND